MGTAGDVLIDAMLAACLSASASRNGADAIAKLVYCTDMNTVNDFSEVLSNSISDDGAAGVV